jgi:hypothetical protein
MKLAVAIALVTALGTTEIERAQQVARSRDSERTQFHRKYLFDLPGDTVTQIEVVTEFRRLVMMTEDRLRVGDQMFSRGLRAAEAAMAPTRGLLTLKAQVRFHPLNTYASVPRLRLALVAGPGPTDQSIELDTQVTSQSSPPYKARNGRRVTALTGAVLQADTRASDVGQTTRIVAVTLDSKELARTPVDFGHLD